MSDRDRTQFFADRPATLSLFELIEQYRDNHLFGRLLDAAEDAAEIHRRLTLVEQFGGTEATRIKSILSTGSDEGSRP